MWQSLSIAKKIYLCMAVIVLGYTVSMVFVITAGQASHLKLTVVSEALFPASQQAQLALSAFEQQVKAYEDAVFIGDNDLIDAAQERATATLAILGAISQLPGLAADGQRQPQDIASQLKKYTTGAQALYSEMATGKMDQKAKAAALSEQATAIKTKLEGLNKMFSQTLHEEISSIQSANQRNQLINGGLFLTVVALASLMSVLVVGGVMRRIAKTVERLRDISEGEGDLTARLESTQNDELGELSRHFNRFVEKLRGIISQVSNNSVQLNDSAKTLKDTVIGITGGAKDVAAQATAIASSSQEMAATSEHIAQSCLDAANSAEIAKKTANEGSTIVQHTIVGMGRIAAHVQVSANTVESLGARSDQIGQITATIQGIADQINLLALNAAIEAARAGEQGRGFAVVADEVRALAGRTSNATKGIRDMIKSIQTETKNAVLAMEEGVKEVEQGKAEAEKSGKALQAILEQINTVAMQVNQIAAATEQQTSTTNEITSNIHRIGEIAQNNSHGAQISTDTTLQLDKLAKDLRGLVGHFKIH